MPENLRQQVQPTPTTKKVVAEPKLSSVRSDYLGEYENVKLGQELGTGGNKDVYSVQGREDLAIGILREGDIDELQVEIEELQKLASEGLQTIEVLGTTTHNNRPAIVMKKYAQGSKNIVQSVGGKARRVDGANIRLLNQSSINDLGIIRQLMVRKKIFIDDLQFMIASDGHVYITDPIEVILGYSKGATENNLTMIDLLIEAAQQNIFEKGR
ncbi:hypothetical protein A6770_38875 [Nostoc minutum NIES-26]|uniref:Type III secretion system effector HopBF1-like domain-containing protein n=1 Tax=Nostoc minutum NIES-26 TaxID=1844469 RepID=A0A367RST4_9NOSO|nr:hypothetical protein A6770_38875 [Nostoc minutum NIES-26]